MTGWNSEHTNRIFKSSSFFLWYIDSSALFTVFQTTSFFRISETTQLRTTPSLWARRAVWDSAEFSVSSSASVVADAIPTSRWVVFQFWNWAFLFLFRPFLLYFLDSGPSHIVLSMLQEEEEWEKVRQIDNPILPWSVKYAPNIGAKYMTRGRPHFYTVSGPNCPHSWMSFWWQRTRLELLMLGISGATDIQGVGDLRLHLWRPLGRRRCVGVASFDAHHWRESFLTVCVYENKKRNCRAHKNENRFGNHFRFLTKTISKLGRSLCSLLESLRWRISCWFLYSGR